MSRRARAGSYLTPGLAAGPAAWAVLHEPLRWAGLGMLEAAGALLVPIALTTVVYAPGYLLAGLLVPRSWRAGHRYRHGREFCRSARIPLRIRRAVFAADRYRCVYCGSARGLCVDHVMPWSLGGLSSLWNLMTLCQRCNLIKSNYWRWHSGRVSYRGWKDYENVSGASDILARELRARWSILRWWRAAVTI